MHTGDMSSRYGVNVETDSSTISTGTGLKQEDIVEVAPSAPAPSPPAAPAPAPLPVPVPAPVAAGPQQPPPPAFGHLPPVAPPPGGFTFGPPSNATANVNAGGVNASRVVGNYGLSYCLSRMSIGSDLGVKVQTDLPMNDEPFYQVVLTCEPSNLQYLLNLVMLQLPSIQIFLILP